MNLILNKVRIFKKNKKHKKKDTKKLIYFTCIYGNAKIKYITHKKSLKIPKR